MPTITLPPDQGPVDPTARPNDRRIVTRATPEPAASDVAVRLTGGDRHAVIAHEGSNPIEIIVAGVHQNGSDYYLRTAHRRPRGEDTWEWIDVTGAVAAKPAGVSLTIGKTGQPVLGVTFAGSTTMAFYEFSTTGRAWTLKGTITTGQTGCESFTLIWLNQANYYACHFLDYNSGAGNMLLRRYRSSTLATWILVSTVENYSAAQIYQGHRITSMSTRDNRAYVVWYSELTSPRIRFARWNTLFAGSWDSPALVHNFGGTYNYAKPRDFSCFVEQLSSSAKCHIAFAMGYELGEFHRIAFLGGVLYDTWGDIEFPHPWRWRDQMLPSLARTADDQFHVAWLSDGVVAAAGNIVPAVAHRDTGGAWTIELPGFTVPAGETPSAPQQVSQDSYYGRSMLAGGEIRAVMTTQGLEIDAIPEPVSYVTVGIANVTLGAQLQAPTPPGIRTQGPEVILGLRAVAAKKVTRKLSASVTLQFLEPTALPGSRAVAGLGLSVVADRIVTIHLDASATLGLRPRAVRSRVIDPLACDTDWVPPEGEVIATDPDAYTFVWFYGPWGDFSRSLQLPRPRHGNARADDTHTVDVRLRSSGLLQFSHSYHTTALSLEFEGLSNVKLYEVQAFFEAVAGAELRYHDHQGQLWRVHVLQSPIELVTQLKERGGSLALDLEGVLVGSLEG